MAEEQEGQQQPAGGGMPGIVRKVGVIVAIVLVAVIAALLVFNFVLKPMLADKPDEPEAPPEDKIPLTAVTVEFEKTYASVVMSDPNLPSSTLLYQVSLECANEVTRALVERNMARFKDMLGDLHRNRTREELDDPLVLDGIKAQALQKANEILRRLQDPVDPTVRVTAVLYLEFYIQDL
ncbi:MAG: flagellar basal body-associated FliL family protein [Candidatus Hydrogenedentes bacterium]|nr:flagellar basal body-associated FliL family protein [Candidatus Hydrogenedentota bacterium]